jgi:tetratricopeptide (TPR) repeat protein
MPEAVQAPPSQPGTVFVGREREVTLLRAALAAASGGQGHLVFLSGEPGIGKTRLAEELARHAGAEGATVRWGRCWEGAGTPAFWPWIQILRAQIRETEPAELRSQLGPGAGDLAQLVPELHERLPGIAPPPVGEESAARFRLFDSMAGFLQASAAVQPLVLILEDLHWADAPSLGLLRFLVDEMQGARLLILATYRDIELTGRHPLCEVLGALAYHPLVQRIDIEGLSEEEIEALIAALLGHERAAALAGSIHRQSGGNPFFATEILRTPDDRGVPSGVREAIGNRLRRLSEACNRLLAVAAVIGPEFGLGTLEWVLARPALASEVPEVATPTPVFPLLSEAMGARIVAEVPGVVSGYRFTHALIREVLYAGLSCETRSRLHWHTGTALEALGGADRERGASALAHHFLEAIAGCAEGAPRQGCADKAVLYGTRAAEQATAMRAYEEAVAHYERALAVLEAWAAHDTGRQCEMLLAMGEAQTHAGTNYAARSETFRRAAALARERGEPERLARAALGLAERASTLETASDIRIALLREALDAVDPHDSSVRARLLGSLALATYYPDPHRHSVQLSGEAVAMARRVGDLCMVVLRSRYHVLTEPGQSEERMALATEFLQRGEQTHNHEMVMYGRLYCLYEALARGDVAVAERELAVFSRLADDLRQPFFRSRAIAVRAALALLAGRFADVEQLIREALRLMQHAEEPLVLMTYLQQLALTYWEQGRLGELEGLVASAVEQFPYTPGGRAGLAWFWAEVGRGDEARAEIARVGAEGIETLPHHWAWLLNMALLADACAVVGDTTRAATLYSLLLPYAPHLVFEPSGPICMGSVSFFLGLLAAATGRPTDAIRHLEEALATHTRIGSPPWIANTQCAMAATLRARDQAGDRERACALLAEVMQTTEELGMQRLQRKALALMDQEHVSTATLAHPVVAPAAAAVSSPAPEPKNATLRKEGDYWVVGYKAPPFRLKDRIGLRYLAVLLRSPGREFLAIDLTAAVHGDREPTYAACGAPEPYFDAETRRAYGQRLRDLHAALREAQAFNDRERASRTQAEIDLLTHELGRGIGLGRRVRASGSPIERARGSVTHAIKAALRVIARNHAELGHYLAATINTGTFCSYSPDPRDAMVWEL